jgi:hypothetical protein
VFVAASKAGQSSRRAVKPKRPAAGSKDSATKDRATLARSTIVPEPATVPVETVPRALNVAVLVTSFWFFGGLLLDGWAHNHLDLSREGFFTPYHAVFYSGFVALASVLIVGAWRNRSPGKPWYASFPAGYETMAIGVGIFALGGLLDMLWHIAFGIEQDVQALFSPTHLMLAFGGATMMTGTIRAGLARPDARTWNARFPELIALALFGTLVTFFCMWAFTTGAGIGADPQRLYPALRGDALDDMRDLRIENGMSAVILRSLMMAGLTGWAARRLALPFGAITLLVAVPNVLIAIMLNPTLSVLLVVAAALVAGVAGDLAVALWGRFDRPSWRSRVFAFGVPFIFWAVYLAIAYVTSGGFWWSPHVAYGAPVIGGLFGLLLELSGEARSRA